MAILSRKLPKIALTMGDAAGLGPELLIKAFECKDFSQSAEFVLYGEKAILQASLERFGHGKFENLPIIESSNILYFNDLKLGEAEIINDLKGEHPIILLDDVMSELDSTRQNYILNKMTGKQVFITCCEKETISKLCAGKVIKIEKGKAID